MKLCKVVLAALCWTTCSLAGQAIAGTYNVQAIQGSYSSVRPPILGQYSTAQGLRYATIQAAVNVASSNSVINVGPGVYRENLNFGAKSMITVKSTSGAASTIIDGSSLAPIIMIGQNAAQMAGMPVAMNGFTLQNGYSATTGGVATVGTKSELSFADCIIMNNSAGSGGAFAVAGTGSVLTVRNSLIAKNTATNAGGAINADLSGKVNLINNTITANIAATGASINQLYGATLTGLNNIIFGNVTADGTASNPVFNGPLTATLTYSDIEGGLAGAGNIDAAPLFVNAAGDDFQLTAGSPAIDTAIVNTVPATATPTKDLLGVARPQGAALDMGAYEYAAPVLPVNGICGSANGGTFTVAPSTDLCSTGTTSAVAGSGPFAWTCAGSNGGTTASCSAQLQAPPADTTPPTVVSVDTSNATSSNSFAFTVTFTEEVTAVTSGIRIDTYHGIATVSGSVVTIRFDQVTPVKDQVYTLTIPAGTFKDAAGNLNDLYTAPVTFANGRIPPPPPVNGACGIANGSAFDTTPTTDLCSAGTASVVTGVGPYYWSCAGSNGGTTATCSAQYQAPPNNTDFTPPAVVSVDTSSATSSNSYAFTVTFTEAVVKIGSGIRVGTFYGSATVSGSIATIRLDQANPVKDQAYTLTIPAGTFRDVGGNLNTLYTAQISFANGITPPPPPVIGVCGSANGSAFPSAPTTNLCSAGTASTVTGVGPYYWSCAGSNGGATANCSAQYQAPPSDDVTPPAVVSVVTNSGATESSNYVTVTFTEAVVKIGSGIKIGTHYTIVTVNGSVATIKFDQVTPVKGQTYTLTIPAGIFRDAAGNLNALYTAPVVFAPLPVDGVCGSSNGGIFTAAPTTNLCSTGTASAVTGNGPFDWTCAGSNSGTTATCSAQLQVADTTPPAVVSAVVTTGKKVDADVITVIFSENVSKTKPLDSIIKIGTADTTSTVSGSTVVIKVKSCCLSKVKTGRTYTLIIPAGSFMDAAGNLNDAYSVDVTM